MTTDPVPNKPRRNWVLCGCLIAMPVVAVVITVLAFVGWGAHGSRQMESELVKIRVAEEPTTAMELDRFNAIPASKPDTTQLWIDANAQFDTEAFGKAATDLPIVGSGDEIPPPGRAWPDRQAVEQLLADYANSTASLHQAAELGGAARFPVKFEDGPAGIATLVPHLQQMRGGARILRLEAHVKAHQGDARGGARSIHAIFQLAKAMENEPLLVSQLICVAINRVAVELTAKLLPQVEFSEEDLRILQDDVRSMRLAEALKRGLIDERAICADAFSISPGSNASPAISTLRAGNEDLAYYLRIQRQLIEATDQGFPKALDISEETMEDVKQSLSSPIGRSRYALTGVFVPPQRAAFSAAAHGDGLNKSLDAAIAVELYRRKHGKLPHKLPDLVPEFLSEVPLDPFDGRPLRYVAKKDGYIIYSLGINRKDDGGRDDYTNGDLVLHVKQEPKASGEEQEANEG